MYVSLSGGHAKGAEDGPLLLLQGCHKRIRAFTALALRLLEAEAVPAEEVREAAASVRRYFTEALPKHVEDEERSLAPRLEERLPQRTLSMMTSQHREIEAELAELSRLWPALESAPAELPRLALDLRSPTLRMAGLWEPHLALEEREIFPEVARLPAEARAEIWVEMRQRRNRAGP